MSNSEPGEPGPADPATGGPDRVPTPDLGPRPEGAEPRPGPPPGPVSGPPPTGYVPGSPTGWTPTDGPPTQGYPPPPRRSLGVDLPTVLALAGAVAGAVTYLLGFADWITVSGRTEADLERWGQGLENGTGVPGFVSYDIALNPGRFLIVLGVVAFAAALMVVPRFRRWLPLLAVGAAAGWLGLLASALGLGAVLPLGAGAVLALIVGFVEVAFLTAGAVVAGLRTR